MEINEDNSETGGMEVNSENENVQNTHNQVSSGVNIAEIKSDITEKLNSNEENSHNTNEISTDENLDDKMEHIDDECTRTKVKNGTEQDDCVKTSKYFKNGSGEKVSTKKKSKKNESESIEMDESKDESHLNDLPKNESHPRNVTELTKLCTKSNRDVSCFISSEVPDICKQQPCILGIDEAGRGPVLGPMVYGVCYCPKSKEDDLKETGCADSKSLTEEKRETIFDKICKHREYIGWEVDVISPKIISTSMLRRQKVSLNEVSHNSAIGLLRRALEAGVLVTEVFVDTVGPAEKYEAKLKGLFPELSITVAKKADSTYPIVGGASICAKVTRDVAIKSWTFSNIETSGEWGSGYPNDPVTKKFLTTTMDTIFGFPNIVRFSWSTAEKVLDDNAVQVDWEEEESAKATPSVKSFFSPGQEDKKQHRFFKDRCLKNVVTL